MRKNLPNKYRFRLIDAVLYFVKTNLSPGGAIACRIAVNARGRAFSRSVLLISPDRDNAFDSATGQKFSSAPL